jgi:hypothetical protein
MTDILRRTSRLLAAQWAASLAIVLLLAAGTAHAVAPHNSVVSTSIRNGQVLAVDLANDAVGQDKVRDGAVAGRQVLDETLTRSDFAPAARPSLADLALGSLGSQDVGELTGDDFKDACIGFCPKGYQGLTGVAIDESSVGPVRSASQGGRSRSVSTTNLCDPESAVFVRCTGVQVSLPAPGRLMVLGQAVPGVEGGNSERFKGACRLEIDQQEIPGSQVEFWSQTFQGWNEFVLNVHDITLLVGVTGVLPAGDHVAWLACNQDVSTGAIEYRRSVVTTVALSDL